MFDTTKVKMAKAITTIKTVVFDGADSHRRFGSCAAASSNSSSSDDGATVATPGAQPKKKAKKDKPK